VENTNVEHFVTIHMSKITQQSVFNSDTLLVIEYITNNVDYFLLGTSLYHCKSCVFQSCWHAEV